MSEQNITQATEKTPERVSRRAVVTPPVDIYENKDEVLVIADVPGASPEGLNVRFDKDQLFIEATSEPFGEEHNPLFREFGVVDYRRVFELAPVIEVENIKAEIKNGVLAIHLPKSEATKPRKIQVTAG